MKTFWAAIVIFAALIGGGIAYNISLDNLSGRLLDTAEEIELAINKGDFETANKRAGGLGEYIDKQKPLFASILNHENIDEIEQNISELLGYTGGEKLVEAQVSIKKLSHLFEHLPENYRLELQNIL